MAESFGSYLQGLRVARKLTTAQLARMAGIRRATLSEWQQDKRRPRLPELDAVFSALGVSDQQKRQTQERLNSSAQLLRTPRIDSDPNLASIAGHIPHGGDLIRAMRLRKGWDQSRLAQLTGVSQRTLSRWERAEQWPSTEQIHRICFLLEAHEDELIALTLGRFSLAEGNVRLTAEQIQERLLTMFTARYLPLDNALTELRLLGLIGNAWELASRGESGRQMLASVYSTYADHLYLHHRFEECRTMAVRALDIYSECRSQDDGVNRAAIRLAEASVKAGGQKGLNSAIHILENWRFHAADQKNGIVQSGWILGDLARFKARRGQFADAIALAEQALQESIDAESHIEQVFRAYDLAEVLLDANRPYDAYQLLQGESHPHFRVVDARTHPHFRIVDARIELLLGRHAQAAALLQDVQGWMDIRAYMTQAETSFYRPTVEALSEQAVSAAMQPPMTSSSYH